jgi:hypothetical protein
MQTSLLEMLGEVRRGGTIVAAAAITVGYLS